LTCTKVSFRRGDLVEVRVDGARAARTEQHWETSITGRGFLELDGPSISRFDASGKRLGGAALACASFLQVVSASADALEVFPSWLGGFVAYHPDDATRWYKNRAACEREVAVHQPTRLEPGRKTVAFALRTAFGCGV
jgi:hypothetical protein